MEEQNPRLTTGSSPVYQRFITGTRSALSSWLPTSGPPPFCLCKPYSCKACPGTDGGTKPAVDHRFITGLSAVYHRDDKRSSFLAADQCTDAYLVSVNFFHARHIREYICRVQNPDIPRAGRCEAASGGTAGQAGTGSTGCRRRQYSPRRKQILLAPRRWKNVLLGVPLEARTREILCKPIEERNPRLNRCSRKYLA